MCRSELIAFKEQEFSIIGIMPMVILKELEKLELIVVVNLRSFVIHGEVIL